jgi:hypothetical protein
LGVEASLRGKLPVSLIPEIYYQCVTKQTACTGRILPVPTCQNHPVSLKRIASSVELFMQI